MNLVRVTLLVVASVMSASPLAGDAKPVVMTKPPVLPAITKDILPGEGWAVGAYKLHAQARIFNTWKSQRRQIATVGAGVTFTLLSGLSEVIKPDLIKVTSPISELALRPGDELLRFTERGEGNGDFWANGYWHSSADLSFVRNADGSGCQSRCKANEVETGRKTWWFRIRLADGRIGWTNAADSLNPNQR